MADSNDTSIAAGDLEEHRHTERRRGEQRRIARALWQGAVAILVAIVALLLATIGGWHLLTMERALEHARSTDELARGNLDSLRTAITRLEASTAANTAELSRLAPLPEANEKLDERLARIEERIETPQRVVARVEAAHLVELAIHRLTLERDLPGATRLYEEAAARLAAANDGLGLRLRAQIERDLERLRAIKQLDIGAVGARLAAAGEVAHTLPMLGMIQSEYQPGQTEPSGAHGIARAWQELRDQMRELVTVRRVSDASVQLVSLEESSIRRQHLEALLFAARLAVLRGDDADYAANLADARNWLGRFFDTHATRGQALDSELAALAALRISPEIPDLSATLKLMRAVTK